MTEKHRPTVSQSMIDAAAIQELPPPDPEAVALRMQGAQVVLEPDSAARAGAMGIYDDLKQNEFLRDAGYLQMGLNPNDPSNELTDPPVLPGETPPPGGNGGEATAPVNVDIPHVSQNGADLNCTMGNWEGEPTTYSYAWMLDGITVGTDSSIYTTMSGDVGMTATCVVTATNAAGSTAAPPSVGVVVA